jgi:anti-sigma regulatory factor (Ser/Thr protein kinase)
MPVRITLPVLDLRSERWGWTAFLSALSPYWLNATDVLLDFGRCDFLSADGSAVLAAFALRRRSWGGATQLDLETVRPDLRKQLGRWKLTELFGLSNFRWTDNAIPLFHQTQLDSKELLRYFCTHLQSGQNMPSMSENLAREVRRSLFELFQNIFSHAQSPCGGWVIGQYYPVVKQFQFCVCDCGIGIVDRVRGARKVCGSPGDAISWALKRGTTTRSAAQGPGGLGLYLLTEFVKLNGGSLRILANDAYYSAGGGSPDIQTLPIGYPGTLLQIRLKVRDDVHYTFAAD